MPFVKAYDGENAIHHNGTGEKGPSVYKVKGIENAFIKKEFSRTDWDWLIYPEGFMTCCCELKAITRITTKSISLKTAWGIKTSLKMASLWISRESTI